MARQCLVAAVEQRFSDQALMGIEQVPKQLTGPEVELGTEL